MSHTGLNIFRNFPSTQKLFRIGPHFAEGKHGNFFFFFSREAKKWLLKVMGI